MGAVRKMPEVASQRRHEVIGFSEDVSEASTVVSLKFVEEEPRMLRHWKAQKARSAPTGD